MPLFSKGAQLSAADFELDLTCTIDAEKDALHSCLPTRTTHPSGFISLLMQVQKQTFKWNVLAKRRRMHTSQEGTNQAEGHHLDMEPEQSGHGL